MSELYGQIPLERELSYTNNAAELVDVVTESLRGSLAEELGSQALEYIQENDLSAHYTDVMSQPISNEVVEDSEQYLGIQGSLHDRNIEGWVNTANQFGLSKDEAQSRWDATTIPNKTIQLGLGRLQVNPAQSGQQGELPPPTT